MFDFIVNPIAGGRHGKKMIRNLSRIEKHLAKRKVAYSIHVTEHNRHAKTLTEELIRNGATNIIVVGGDGTLHEVLNGFSCFDKVALGIIPCGTGNDFATAIGLPKNPEDALDVILDGEAKYTDFMQMPTVRGMNIIGMGIDVDVLKKYNNLKKKTKFGYTLCLIKTLFKFNYSKFIAELNGKSEEHNSFIACVANGSMYGGGIPICPVADATDKKLDFVTIKQMPKLKLVSAFLKLKRGKVMSVPEVTHETMSEIRISTEGDYTVNVDGELYDNIPFEVKIVSDALRVYR